MKVFVTGGSGFVGGAFITYWLKKSPENRIVAMSRSEKADDAIKKAAKEAGALDRCEIVKGDLTTPAETLGPIIKGCQGFVHSAAHVNLTGPWETFVKFNVDGTKNMVQAADLAGVETFVHIGTEACFFKGWGTMKDISDELDLPGNNFDKIPKYAPYSRSKALAEKYVIDYSKDHQMRTISIRPRMIWGNNDTNILPAMVGAVKSGQLKWFSGGENLTCTTHITNLCHGIDLCFQKGKTGQTYFVLDNESPMTFKAFVTMLLATQDIDTSKIGKIPVNLVWGLATTLENIPFWDYAKSPTRDDVVTRQMLGLMAQDVVISDAKARKELGYDAIVSMDQGMKELQQAENVGPRGF